MALEFESVQIVGSSGQTSGGKIAFQKWTPSERKTRAIKKTGKIVGSILAVCSLGLFIHVLLVVLIPTAVLAILAFFPIYFKFSGEEATFFYAEGTCPHCKKKLAAGKESKSEASPPGTLRPYINSRFSVDVKEIVVQCPDCGETARARRS